MKTLPRWTCTIALAVSLLLSACAGTQQRIADCKVGDWQNIGRKDGAAGIAPNFAERKEFCDQHEQGGAKADPAAGYAAGWALGNADFWSALGEADGRAALPASTWDSRAASPDVHKKSTPLNRGAYESGWTRGLAAYWEGLGKREGTAGRPVTQKEGARGSAAAQGIRFDEAAWLAGWKLGNRTYWQDAGFEDARNGVPDSAFRGRDSAAREAGVLVQEDAYRQAWNGEIPNYWQRLGTLDAVTGKDFAMRRAEAQKKGLKIFETAYRSAWEARLADYWSKAGHDDGFGQPFLLERRIADAARNGVFVVARTRELYSQAWAAENARYCNPDNAFESGRRNAGIAIEVCQPPVQNQLKRAYLSGQDYEAAAGRLAAAQTESNGLERRLHELRRQIEKLDKEIRGNLDKKDRVVNEETAKQDKRREQERHELAERFKRVEREWNESRHREERLQRDMEGLRRDIYLN
jgi:hypothetical protein